MEDDFNALKLCNHNETREQVNVGQDQLTFRTSCDLTIAPLTLLIALDYVSQKDDINERVICLFEKGMKLGVLSTWVYRKEGPFRTKSSHSMA